MGTVDAGNHYADIQEVDAIFEEREPFFMGINQNFQAIFIIHSVSCIIGHEVCTDKLTHKETDMERDGSAVKYIQLACARVQ